MLSYEQIAPIFRELPFAALILSVTDDYRIVEVTSSFARMANLNAETVVGRSPGDSIPDLECRTHGPWVKISTEALMTLNGWQQSEKTAIFRYRAEGSRPEGTTQYWKADFTPMLNEKQDPGYLLCAMHDVTDLISPDEDPGERMKSTPPNPRLSPAQEYEQRFRCLIEHSEDIIIAISKSLEIVYVSPAFTQTTGHSLEDVQQLTISEFYHPDDFKESLRKAPEVEQNPGVLFARTVRLKAKQGGYIWVEGSVIFVSDTGHTGYICNYRDITARKEAEEKLLESERNLRAIFDNSVEGFVLIDRSLTIIACNAKAQKFILSSTGFLIQEKRPFLDFVRNDKKANFEQVAARVFKGETVSYESVYTGEGGQETWYHFFVSPVFYQEEVTGLFITGRDITMSKLAGKKLEAREKRYHALVENSADAFAILSPEGRPMYVSSSIQRVLGYSVEEILQMDLGMLMHPDDQTAISGVMEQLLLNPGISIMGHTGRMLHKDGTWRWVEATAANMLDIPEIGGIVDTFRDVTEKVDHVRAIEEQNNRLREIAWMQSHVVRAPLARVMGLVNLIEMSPAGEGLPELLPLLKISANELDQVIRQIIDKTEAIEK